MAYHGTDSKSRPDQIMSTPSHDNCIESWPNDFRYAGGDVLVKFNHSISGTLLLHREVLGRSPVLGRALSTA